jgi:hypothetical protein
VGYSSNIPLFTERETIVQFIYITSMMTVSSAQETTEEKSESHDAVMRTLPKY